MKNFVRDSRNGFILKNGEESSAGYGLAYDISKRYSTVSKFKFYILTDMIMSSRIKDIQGLLLKMQKQNILSGISPACKD